ncbi:AMP-binding protein [Streptomyces sp. NPDC127068]|uniref:AMP-binding protein n=1 Tax=Streptomyces sp. NPDC127068 TaxID=3347127 RepID=UPI00365ADC5D
MTGRPLHALVLPPRQRLRQALARALDGTGPAICPLSPTLPALSLRTVLTDLRPTTVETPFGARTHSPGGTVDPGVAVVMATSGSTGRPKLVELTADALLRSASTTLDRVGARPQDRWLCCLPTDRIAGLQVLTRSLLAGTDPVILPRFDTTAVAASDANLLAVVPTQLLRLLDAGVNVARFRAVLVGGAALPGRLRARARTHGARIVTTYGMTETCGGCVYDGEPPVDVRVRIGDDGLVQLSGPVLFHRYHGDPELSAAAWRGDWFVTHDLGVMSGGRLHVLGRVDDIINTGGHKVAAGHVADVLSGHPCVAEVVVVGRPDAEWGERVTAVVVPRRTPPTLTELRSWLRDRLPAYAAPRELELRQALPRLASGKPDRVSLRTSSARPPRKERPS